LHIYTEINIIQEMAKDLVFVGASLKALQDFPAEVRREAGAQLRRVQSGDEPADWKPMPTIGAGVREIRLHVAGAWRVIYVAKFANTVHVLHAFAKKTQRTPKQDLELAAQRYRNVVAQHRLE
jgi:phage-related protein